MSFWAPDNDIGALVFWGKLHFKVNHDLGRGDAEAFIHQLEKDPTQLSPITIGGERRGDKTYGYPIPIPTARIGVAITGKEVRERADGSKVAVLKLRYSEAFEGPGRIVAEQDRYGNLTVRDEWNGVANYSGIPSLAVRVGHAQVVGLGFRNILSKVSSGAHSQAQ